MEKLTPKRIATHSAVINDYQNQFDEAVKRIIHIENLEYYKIFGSENERQVDIQIEKEKARQAFDMIEAGKRVLLKALKADLESEVKND